MTEPVKVAVNWAFGLPLVAGLVALGLLPSASWWLQLVLAISSLTVLGYLFLISANWLFGPVLLYELVRLTRTPRVPAMRTGYGLLLLIALFLIYLRYIPGSGHEQMLATLVEGAPISPTDRADFAATFFYAFLALQFMMLLLFTPALIAGSIATERQRGTLDLLLTTDLTNREIILGKLASQLAYLFLLLLTGLPILSFLQLLGGIEPNLIVTSFLATVISMGTLGTVCMVGATGTDRVATALRTAYGLGFIHIVVSFVGMLLLANDLKINIFDTSSYRLLGIFTGYNALISCVCVFLACRWLRPMAPVVNRKAQVTSLLVRLRHASLRPVLADRDPMVWKEIYYERGMDDRLSQGLDEGRLVCRVLVVVSGLLLVGYVTASLFNADRDRNTFADFWNGLTLYFSVPAMQLVLFVMAMRAAAGVSRERESQTFEGLLVTPLSNWEIVRGKWVACVWIMRYWALSVGILYAAGVMVGGVSPLAIPLVLLAVAIHTAFVINLGMYCSLTIRSTLRATITAVVGLVLIAAGHWLVALGLYPLVNMLYGAEAANRVFDVHLWTLTLPCNLGAVSFYNEDLQTPGFVGDRLIPGLIGIAYYAGLALLLHWGVCRRMRRYRQG